MSRFTADWLALREPADIRARASAAWPEGIDSGCAPTGEILDLGAGTGANLRYLAPRLPTPQRWLLIDHDAGLLLRALQRVAHDGLRDTGIKISTQELDLAHALVTLAIPTAALVTASALLDLVSAQWLDVLLARCVAAQASILFALNYDGRIELDPSEADDRWLVDLDNLHQRGDKGFGPALGPAAIDVATARFVEAGYVVRRARSDWLLGPKDCELQRALIDGWASAATEITPAEAPRIAAWRARRKVSIESGRSQIRVGHHDLAGQPAGSGSNSRSNSTSAPIRNMR